MSTVSHAIGLQHGVFRSQSTQGKSWQGTATITKEHFDITVYPDYLDVELEWVFQAGGTAPDSFKNALEVVGNLNLAANSTVVGMITWYNGKILKGKLKTDSVAREQYENVVDRSSERPTPPRDPVLLEYGWGKDNYDISIFPVSYNGTRQVRIRYLVPAVNENGVNKIIFPSAFTKDAVVNIRKGSGLDGYIVETNLSKKQFDNREPVSFDNKVYEFEAYGRSGYQRIAYIVPVVSRTTSGSIIYSGSFSTPTSSGEVYHVSTLSAKRALNSASIAEDYVILWRWNHPQILAKYARQIVEQSTLLKKFLSTLKSANKRAALVIDIEGGEAITFHLDKTGGNEFKRMINHLDSLSNRTTIDPPVSAVSKQLDIECNAEKELKEFENAIQTAIDLFEKDASTLKHLLILTAGPQIISLYSGSVPNIKMASGVDVNLLTDYLQSNDIGTVSTSTNQMYWPGVNVSGFMQKFNGGLSVYATVSNGRDTNRITVLDQRIAITSSYSSQQTTEMHLYSERPLAKEIRWSIYKDSSLLTSFTETPEVIAMSDGMQYSRLIGSSQHLVPLASKMPSSMASTFGFIDEKYSLVTLEEDSLPAVEANSYEIRGVPLLNATDIFPASNERADLPVSEWLKANPPEPFSQNNGITMWGVKDVMFARDAIMFEAVIPVAQKVSLTTVDNTPARVASQQAQTIYSAEASGYLDYSDALSIKDPVEYNQPLPKTIPFVVNHGSLMITMSKFGITGNEPVQITLYNCSGRVIGVWNSVSSQSNFSINLNAFAHGSYMLRVSSKSLGTMQQMIVR